MATHIFDIDGTIVHYHTNIWLVGAKAKIMRLATEGHGIIFITMRHPERDKGQIWSVENTKATILKELDDLGIKYIALFGVDSPRIIHDDSEVYVDHRRKNQSY